MYSIFRGVTSLFSAEWTHDMTLKILKFVPEFCFEKPEAHPVQAMGLEYKHPIGLAAGFDKDGKYLNALTKLGFASIELGTVTPRPQSGNPKPRLFRAPELQALVNRMGFNNAGVDNLVENLKKVSFGGVLGVSIGPNKNTLPERVWLDYEYCLKKVYPHVDYVAVNISSPNTPGLRALHHKAAFTELVQALVSARSALQDEHGQHVPIVVKVSPDESDAAIQGMAEGLVTVGLDGMILTNTTVSRAGFQGTRFEKELGGVSGAPLKVRAMQCLQLAKQVVGDDLTLIASGGIDSPKEAAARLEAGASLVQLYSGLVYEGPSLITRAANACSF